MDVVATEVAFHLQEVVVEEVLSKDTEVADLLSKVDLTMGAQMLDLHSTVEEVVNELDLREDLAMIEGHSLETERHQEVKTETGKTFTKDLRDLATTLETDSSEWTRCETNPSKSSSQKLVTTSTERSKIESAEIKEIDQLATSEAS